MCLKNTSDCNTVEYFDYLKYRMPFCKYFIPIRSIDPFKLSDKLLVVEKQPRQTNNLGQIFRRIKYD